MIQRNKRRLGRNSQAGQEASNLVGQLQEEFVNTTKGFKEVLKVRSDLIKERSDKRSEVFGRRAGGANAGAGANGEGNQDGFVLGNKPRVYDTSSSSAAGNTGELEFGKGGLGSTGGMGMNVPKLDLDLTSGLMNKGYNAGGVGTEISGGDSASQLPRPRECYLTCSVLLVCSLVSSCCTCVSCTYLCLYFSQYVRHYFRW